MSFEIEMSRNQCKSVTVRCIEEVKAYTRNGWVVDSVNETGVVGMCEICDLPILESDEFYSDEEGVCWHQMCDKEDSA